MKLAPIKRSLEQLTGLPAEVYAWALEAGEDSTGMEAVWVWITLLEDADFATRERVRETVREAVEGHFGLRPPWIYVRFLLKSEVESGELPW